MKNTLNDLNNYLFETLERLTDDDCSIEELEKEITRSKAVVNVAETIVKNGVLTLSTVKTLNEYGIETNRSEIPALLGFKK